MAVDKLQELQEQRNDLAAEIKTLGDSQDSWGAEERERWDVVNAEYDSILESQAATQQQLDVSARLDAISEERQKSEWQAKRNDEP